jgi:hypothetical protein
MSRLVVRLAVAVVMAAAAGLSVSAPAQAATCSGSHGVSVVVDFHELGGGVQTRCDRGGAGESAWTQLEDVGYDLTGVTRQPGFICRIDGKPTVDQDPCVNTPPSDAYWSLWWSDGTSGKWSYSSQGPASLKVPDGGYVGMSWQGGNGKAQPGVTPSAHPAKPTRSPTSQAPSPHPSSQPATAPAGPTQTASGSDPTGDTTSKGPRHGAKDTKNPKQDQPTKTASAGPQAAEPLGQVARTASSDDSGSDSGGLPGWVAPAAIAVLFVGAGGIALTRRKSRGGP